MRGHLQFPVKWEGYGYEENSWVTEQDVTALDKLYEFYWIHPGAPCQIHSMAFQSLMSCALKMQHTRGGVMSGDAPSHTSTVPDSTLPLGQNSALLCFLSWNSTPLPSQTPLCPHVGDPLHLCFQDPGSVKDPCSAGSVCTK